MLSISAVLTWAAIFSIALFSITFGGASASKQLLKGTDAVLTKYTLVAVVQWTCFFFVNFLTDEWILIMWNTLSIGVAWFFALKHYHVCFLSTHFVHLAVKSFWVCSDPEQVSQCRLTNAISLTPTAIFYGGWAWSDAGLVTPLLLFGALIAQKASLVWLFGARVFVECTRQPSDLAAVAPIFISTAICFSSSVLFSKFGGDLYRNCRAVFARYVSSAVVDELLYDPQRSLRIGGSRRHCTIVMSDLRGFSNLMASMTPEDAISLMNRYLEAMIDIIDAHGGIVDEIIGDALLIIFGLKSSSNSSSKPVLDSLASSDCQEAARQAVRCAAAMQRAMITFPTLAMGVGIHSGEVVVGNIGSVKRSKFGIIGAPVNMAARVESFSLGHQILVSGALADLVGGQGGDGGFHWRLAESRTVHPKGAGPAGLRIALVQEVEGQSVGVQGATTDDAPLVGLSPVLVDVEVLGGAAKTAQAKAVGCRIVEMTSNITRLRILLAKSKTAPAAVQVDKDVRFQIPSVGSVEKVGMTALDCEILGRIVATSENDFVIAVTFIGRLAYQRLSGN